MFEVVIENHPQQNTDATVVEGQPASEEDGATTFMVHKALLESVSEEMKRHINNSMKEGLSNRMILHDVTVDTFTRFLQWAYSNNYSYPDAPDKDQEQLPATVESPTNLLVQVRLFVFAERFNIIKLRILAGLRLLEVIEWMTDDPSWSGEQEDVTQVCKAFHELFDNIPISTPIFDEKTPIIIITKPGQETQITPTIIASFCARNFQTFRPNSAFQDVLRDFPDFSLAFVDQLMLRALDLSNLEKTLAKEKWHCGDCFSAWEGYDQPRVARKCPVCSRVAGGTLAETWQNYTD